MRTAVALLLALGLAAPAALAQSPKGKDPKGKEPKDDPAATKEAEARRLFGEAEALYNVGEYEKALELYKQAYLLSQAPALLYNMGQCQRRLGRLSDALDSYRAFLRGEPKTPLRADTEALIAELEATLASRQTAKITISSTPPGAEVRRTVGQKIEILGTTPLVIDQAEPGEYKLRFSLSGYQPGELSLVVEGGQTYVFPEVALQALPKAEPLWFHRPYLDFQVGSGLFVAGELGAPIQAGTLGVRYMASVGKRGFRVGAQLDGGQGNGNFLRAGVPIGWQFVLPTKRPFVLTPQLEPGFVGGAQNKVQAGGLYFLFRPGLNFMFGREKNLFVESPSFAIGPGGGSPILTAQFLTFGYRLSWYPKDIRAEMKALRGKSKKK